MLMFMFACEQGLSLLFSCLVCELVAEAHFDPEVVCLAPKKYPPSGGLAQHVAEILNAVAVHNNRVASERERDVTLAG